MNLASLLRNGARSNPDGVGLRDGRDYTYVQLESACTRAAGDLTQSGIVPGDRVGLMLPNGATFATLYYAILRVGAIVVPINPLLKAREVHHHLQDAGARLLLASGQCATEAQSGANLAAVDCQIVGMKGLGSGPSDPVRPESAPYVDRVDAQTAVILYTSGTTGRRKGPELTHANLRACIRHELAERARSNLAPYKYPRHKWITDKLPKGPTGKILKREIDPPIVLTD